MPVLLPHVPLFDSAAVVVAQQSDAQTGVAVSYSRGIFTRQSWSAGHPVPGLIEVLKPQKVRQVRDQVLASADHPGLIPGTARIPDHAARRSTAAPVGGLDEKGLAAKVGASALTPGGLIKHLAFVEDLKFTTMLLGQDLVAPWNAVDWENGAGWPWHSAAQDSPGTL